MTDLEKQKLIELFCKKVFEPIPRANTDIEKILVRMKNIGFL